MIVTCSACQTQFQLDSTRVVGDWTPLRCLQCQTCFTVTVNESLHTGVALVVMTDIPFRGYLEQALRESGIAVKSVDHIAAGHHYLHLSKPDLLVVADHVTDGAGMSLWPQPALEMECTPIVWRVQVGFSGDQPKEEYPLGSSVLVDGNLSEQEFRDRFHLLWAQFAEQKKHRAWRVHEIRRAERLARTILSDIILYNPEEVEQGIAQGTFFEVLAEELKDARQYYVEQIHPEILRETNYFETFLENYVTQRKQEKGGDSSASNAQLVKANENS